MDLLQLMAARCRHRLLIFDGGVMSKIYTFDCVTSTFDKINEFPPEHLLTVAAKRQTSGCGRRGRIWQSDEGGLYFSTLLDAKYFEDDIGFCTIVCTVAVARTIYEFGNCSIKWPNDIVINGKKVCGILTKLTSTKSRIDFICAGIGVNTNTSQFDKSLTSASSILLETGKKCDDDKLLNNILDEIEKSLKKDKKQIIEEYKNMCITLGREVVVHHADGSNYAGMCIDITENGELIVECEGKTLCVNSGEVSVRGLYGYV